MRTSAFSNPTVPSAPLLLMIKNGRSGTAMPAWVGKLSMEEIFEVAGQLFTPESYLSSTIPTHPGHNTFSNGIGETFASIQPCPWWRGDSPVNGETSGHAPPRVCLRRSREDLALRVFHSAS